MRRTVVLGVALLSLGSVALVWAQPQRDRDRIHQKLDLTDQQREELKALHFNTARGQIKMRADLKIARLELKEILTRAEPNRKEVDQKLDQIAKIQTDLRKSQIDRKLAIREILDEEQLAKLRELKRDREMWHRKGKPSFRGPGRDFRPRLRGYRTRVFENGSNECPLARPQLFFPAEEPPLPPELGFLGEPDFLEDTPLLGPDLDFMEPELPIEESPELPN
jgi:Spy/CpxP family protein refolding chaperone